MKDIYLQYISQGNTPREHLVNIGRVCEAGCRWVQLRLKDVDAATHVTTAIQCREICDQYGAIMIINDKVSVAKASQADGVHLGLTDMNVKEARKILGTNSIIGGTANTIDDCKKHLENQVDYIGLGPYKDTPTKQKLSPILGLEGYKNIMVELRKLNLEIPVVAIGGITSDAIEAIVKTGVHGIAVSGMLTAQDDLEEIIPNIKKLLINS